MALIAFYFFFGLVAASREHTLPFLAYFQAMWLHWMCLAIVIALVLLGSVIFTAPSSNATICLHRGAGHYVCGRPPQQRGGADARLPAAAWCTPIYYAIPHLEWYDVRELIIHNWGADRLAGLRRRDHLCRALHRDAARLRLAGLSTPDGDVMIKWVMILLLICCMALATGLDPEFLRLHNRGGSSASVVAAFDG